MKGSQRSSPMGINAERLSLILQWTLQISYDTITSLDMKTPDRKPLTQNHATNCILRILIFTGWRV